MRRFLRLTLCLLCLPCLNGCLCYVYPQLDYTPSLSLDPQWNDVLVFRAETTTENVLGFLALYEPCYNEGNFEHLSEHLVEVQRTDTNRVPAQIQPSVSTGLLIPFVVVNLFCHTSHSMKLLLYRPGFDLVEIPAWEEAGHIVWKPAADLDAQEKTLDWLAWHITRDISGQREALLLAVEYERLAAQSQDQDQQWRLQSEARRLREQCQPASSKRED
jgi:hypothetical protein